MRRLWLALPLAGCAAEPINAAAPQPRSTTIAEALGLKLPVQPVSTPVPRAQLEPDADTRDCMDRKFARWDSLRGCLEQHGRDPAKFAMSSAQPRVCPATLVTEWDFSPTGSDNNSCVGSGNPCKTFAEVQRRYGCGGSQAIQVFFPNGTAWLVHGDMPEFWNMDIQMVPNPPGFAGAFLLQCDTTTVSSGTLSGVVSKNRSAGQALDANLGASEAGALSLQLSVPARSGLGWVDSTVSGNVALLTQPLNPSTSNEVDTYANSDSFSILRPSQVNFVHLSGQCGANECLNMWPNSGLYPQVLNCWRPAHSGITDIVTLDRVRVDQSRLDTVVGGQSPMFHNTIFTQSFGTGASAMITPQIYAGSITSAGANALVGIQFSGDNGIGSWIYHDVIVHGTVGGGDLLSIESAYCDNGNAGGTAAWNFPFPSVIYPTAAHTPQIYGNCNIQPQFGGVFTYSGPAASNFSSGVNPVPGVAIAWNYSLLPAIPMLRTLSWANLDTAFASGGFSGFGQLAQGLGYFIDWTAPYPTVPSAPAFGTVLCNKTGSGFTWQTVANCN